MYRQDINYKILERVLLLFMPHISPGVYIHMVDLHACILVLTKDSMHGQSTDHSFHYILFCLGDAESLWEESSYTIYHCIVEQLVSEWIAIGFVGGVSGKG